MSRTLEMKHAKRGLATLWFIASGALLLLMIVESNFDHFEGAETEAFGWFFPTVLPTLSLIVGVLVADALGRDSGLKRVDRYMFRLAIGISAAYLFSVGISLFMSPFVPKRPAIELLRRSNLWLGPMKGVVSAILALFFLKAPTAGKTGNTGVGTGTPSDQ